MQKVREYFLQKAKKGVIMVDLDRNLTDEKYDLSDEHVTDLIKEANDKGYLICLNSSRSARKLRYWQERVKTHFPTFAENGLVLDIPDLDPDLNMQIITDDRALLLNDRFRQSILAKTKESLVGDYPNVELKYCVDEEPEDSIKKAVEEKKWKDGNNDYGIYINGWTRVKTVLYAFRKSPTGPQYDNEFTNAVLAILEDIKNKIPYNRPVEFKSYPDDSSILVYPTEQNKTYIWRLLLSYLGNDARDLKFFHLGDGKEDNIRDSRVTVLAPANAKPEIVARSQKLTKIAPGRYSYTRGVMFHLRNIIDGKYA